MTEFSFYLSDADTDRLFTIKERQGRDDLTGNEFARLLLEQELYRLSLKDQEAQGVGAKKS